VTDPAMEHERFAYDDAAYLLGALEPAEHAAFERHLATCPACQQSIAELGGAAGALALADFEALDDYHDRGGAEPAPATLLPRLLAEAGRERTRRGWRAATGGFLAACLLLALAFGGQQVWSHAHRTQPLALQPVATTAGLQATVRLTGDAAHPRIRLDCGYTRADGISYPGQPAYSTSSPPYRMVVYNRAGASEDLGSWSPQLGETVELVRNSPWQRPALARVTIVDAQGTVLLARSL